MGVALVAKMLTFVLPSNRHAYGSVFVPFIANVAIFKTKGQQAALILV